MASEHTDTLRKLTKKVSNINSNLLIFFNQNIGFFWTVKIVVGGVYSMSHSVSLATVESFLTSYGE